MKKGGGGYRWEIEAGREDGWMRRLVFLGGSPLWFS